LNVLRKYVLEIFLSDLDIYLKDDKDVTLFPNNIVAPTINRILRTEKTESPTTAATGGEIFFRF